MSMQDMPQPIIRHRRHTTIDLEAFNEDEDEFGEPTRPHDQINESLGYDADVTDRSQYCKHGVFIGSWWGPDYMCFRCEMGED